VWAARIFQVSELTLSFNAKLTSMITDNRERTTDSTEPYDRFTGYWWSVNRMTGAVTSRSKTTNNSETAQEYSMTVVVRAVQDDAPAGLMKVLSIMEDAILRSE
jgi:hypothetical protein